MTDNATLRKDEWKQYDDAVLQAATERVVGVSDLISRGLTYNIGDGLGTTVLEYENVSDMNDATMDMAAEANGTEDRANYEIAYLPLPIVHKSFRINARALASSRSRGIPLDTTQATICTRKVMEYVETVLFTGSSTYTFGGGTIYGFTDHPRRNTGSLTGAWSSTSAVSGENIVNDVLNMTQSSISARHYGPWVLYVPTGYQSALEDDFKSNSDLTVRERILKIDGIQDVKIADKLTANNVILAQMTPDVVRMVVGMPVRVVEWQTMGNMIFHYKVMTIMVPQVRADQNNRCGITHYSTS
ncbi:MAG: major capsid protein [Candidatus Heimdallarchaeaceae archaeon]